jgi:hypothetical protein
MDRSVATADEARPHTSVQTSLTRLRGLRPPRLTRDRLFAFDWLVPVVALVSLGVYLLHGFDKAMTRDLGLYTYAGQRFLDGDPPYVGVMNRAGPLAHALPGVGIGLGRLVGLSDIHGARAFFMLLAVACVCLVYVVSRDLTGSRAAALVAATAFLGFEGFLDLATNGPREKTPMVLFLLATFLAVRHRRWATAGVFTALATLTWQPVFFVAALTAVVAALLAPDHRLRALVRIVAGSVGVTALVVVYYALNGAVHTFVDCFVLINAQYTQQQGALAAAAANWSSMQRGYGGSLWMILAGLVALPVGAVVRARPAWRTRDPMATTTLALGAGWLGGVLWCLVAFNGWPDLFVMLPLAALGLAWAARVLLGLLRARIAVAVATVLVLAGTTFATAFSVDSRQTGLHNQEAFISAVLDVGPQPATIVSMQAPQVLVMLHRTNPTPYQMFDHGFSDYLDHTYPGGLDGYLADVEKMAPTYIVTQDRFMPSWFQPWLDDHYVSVGITQRFHWWVSNTVSPEMVKQMHEAELAAKQELAS